MNEHESEKVKIIAISGKDAAGRTVVAKFLSDFLKAQMISWYDFNLANIEEKTSINQISPDNRLEHVLWGLKNISEMKYSRQNKIMVPTRYIVFDTPVGRLDKQTNKYIDYCFYIDVPISDVLLAYDSQDILNSIWHDDSLKDSADFIINGMLPISAQVLAIKHYLSYQWYNSNDLEHAV